MTCPNCGNTLPEGNTSCPVCASRLSDALSAPRVLPGKKHVGTIPRYFLSALLCAVVFFGMLVVADSLFDVRFSDYYPFFLCYAPFVLLVSGLLLLALREKTLSVNIPLYVSGGLLLVLFLLSMFFPSAVGSVIVGNPGREQFFFLRFFGIGGTVFTGIGIFLVPKLTDRRFSVFCIVLLLCLFLSALIGAVLAVITSATFFFYDDSLCLGAALGAYFAVTVLLPCSAVQCVHVWRAPRQRKTAPLPEASFSFCPECGTRFTLGTPFCDKCGSPLKTGKQIVS